MRGLQVDASVQLMHDYADLNPDRECSIVAQCFAATPSEQGRALAAFQAVELARARLDTYPRPSDAGRAPAIGGD